MIEFFKLAKLPKSQKLKKIIKILEQLEYKLQSNTSDSNDELLQTFYLKQLYATFLHDLSPELKKLYEKVASKENASDKEKLLLINKTRHYLYVSTGVEPSEWDLIMPDSHKTTNISENIKRNFFKNVFVYAEDIRSPFNLGSIFHTSDAFGVEKIFLSPDCVSSESERAKRSAMGCIKYIAKERIALERLIKQFPKDFPIIALETGGKDINSFDFPKKGILLLGSEELGLSPESLAYAQERVSIKMYGIKASINVGVAFGIFMERWASKLANT